jgi:hypothetical protein
MPVCPHATRCALARSISTREALHVWQRFYCESAFARCERHKLLAAGRDVPDRLLPNGRLLDLPASATPAVVLEGDGD